MRPRKKLRTEYSYAIHKPRFLKSNLFIVNTCTYIPHSLICLWSTIRRFFSVFTSGICRDSWGLPQNFLYCFGLRTCLFPQTTVRHFVVRDWSTCLLDSGPRECIFSLFVRFLFGFPFAFVDVSNMNFYHPEAIQRWVT